MIQPAALPFAGNLLMALGLPGDGAAEPGISADFSTMLAANIAGEPASAAPASASQPALAAASINQGGKPAGKTGGKILPDAPARTVRSLPLALDSAAAEPSVKVELAAKKELAAEEPGDRLLADMSPATTPYLAAAIAAAGLPQSATTPLLPAIKIKASARLTTGAATRRIVQGIPLTPAPAANHSPTFDKLRLGDGKGPGGGPAIASMHGPTALHPHTQPLLDLRQAQERLMGEDQAPSTAPGANSLPASFQLIATGEVTQPPMALPIAALHAPSFTLLRAAPLGVDPATQPQAEIISAETPPAQPSPAGLQPQGLAFSSQAFVSQPRVPAEAARQGEGDPTETSAPTPTAPASEPSADTPTLPPASAIAPAATQPFINPANPPPVLSSAPVQPPHDFSALIDRLVEARDMAQASAAPGVVHAAVAHGDFGQVSLQFQQDGGGLTVALTSNDPDFARAVQAAAPAGQTATGSDQGAAPRQDPRQDSQQSPGSQFAQSNGQQRGHSQSREGGNPRSSANPSQSQRGADEPPPRGGIFA